MDYREKTKEYKERIKNKDTLKFVDFLDALLDWIDILIDNKSLAIEQKKDVLNYMPKELFEELDKISPTEMLQDKYDKLKKILDEKSASLVKYIADNGNIKMTDFDLFQFNLYQIFGKEELASMIEESRLYLEDVILKERVNELEEIEKKEKEQKEWLEKVNAMPEEEMHKLILDSMFNFKPSARTHEERLEAINHNKRRVLSQRNKFRKFETRLMDATTLARKDAQSHVYRRIGNVRRHMDKVTNEFREKAKIFVSEEGPKKMVREARGRIIEGKARVEKGEKRLRKELEGKGKEWKKNFGAETKKAQDKILERKRELDMEMAAKGKEWKDSFGAKTNKARYKIIEKQKELDTEVAAKGKEWKDSFGARTKKAQAGILGKRKILSAEQKQTKNDIIKKGKAEVNSARDMIFEGKSDFEEDVKGAKEMFAGKGEEIDKAREDFIDKRGIAQESFTRRGAEVEEEIYGTLIHERKRFEKERDEARAKFQKRAGEISGHAGSYMSGKRDKFHSDRKQAQEKFLTRAGEIKAKPIKQKTTESHGEKLTVKAGEAKNRIDREHMAVMEKARVNRERMKQEMMHKRELFLYDTRFARHRIQENAKAFAEKAAAKREEFETRGEQLVARHKAHQKAHLINNLLRTIRGMH